MRYSTLLIEIFEMIVIEDGKETASYTNVHGFELKKLQSGSLP